MNSLERIVVDNRGGLPRGLPSYCTAHPETLGAILGSYRDDAAPILIEATCNQVNQTGGYTGMAPSDFRDLVERLARAEGVDPSRIILGGDHLGPNPWRHESATRAMDKARIMVAAYVAAGFSKIHLDTSMACADDGALSDAAMAERAADLCAVAEGAAAGRSLVYVVGTEVPVPGGELTGLEDLAITTPGAAVRTFDLHRAAFAARGLQDAANRIIGVVVQPGVDFGNGHVVAFDPDRANVLSQAVRDLPSVVFEAHSTDYQSEAALRALVGAHFAILKVGPELTFAFRQAVLALAGIEAALEVQNPSGILDAIRSEMHADPANWRPYVAADGREAFTILYGLSDRVRYYWPRPPIRVALDRLLANIAAARPEPGLVAQFTGGLVSDTAPADLPRAVIAGMVGSVVGKYRAAARS